MNFIKEYNKELTKEMLDKSLVVIDNNCLLFPIKDYIIGDKIVDAFNSIEKRVYIPFVTQIEYLENEQHIIDVRKENVSRAKRMREDIKDINILIDSAVKNIVNNKLFNNIEQIKKADDKKSLYKEFSDFKINFIDEIEKTAMESLEKLNSELIDKKNRLYDNFSWTHLSDDVDSIRKRMESFLDEASLGGDYDVEVLNDYIQKIGERYNERVSPGYIDDKNDKTITLGGKKVNRSFSDAIFWLDTLDFIKQNQESTDNRKYLVILSNEVKEDWVINRESSRLNIDMYSECYRETGLIAKKIDIWKLLEITTTAEDVEIEKSKDSFEDEYSRKLIIFGNKINFGTDFEFILRVFEETIKKYKIKFSDIQDMPCIAEKGEKTFTTPGFGSQKILVDAVGHEFIIGTQTVKKSKLESIKELFDRYQISYDQLTFEEKVLEDMWKEVQILGDTEN